MDGGNFTINGGSDASVMAIRDCTLGGDGTFVFQGRTCFGASRYGSGFGSGPTRVNNTFAKTGTYVKIDNETTRPPTFYNVTAGQPVNI